MPSVSNVYQVETHINDYTDLAYSWGDSTHPETYQSFVTTGNSAIDQSIFSFKRKHDAWSLGAYCLQRYYSGSSDHRPKYQRTTNRFSKNNVMVTNRTRTSSDYLYSSNIINECKYSPGVPTLSTLIYPYINYPYAPFTIIPKFVVMNPSVPDDYRTNLTYNEVVNGGFGNWGVQYITLDYYGFPGNNLMCPLTVQFAGDIYSEEWIPVYGDVYRLGISQSPESGVFYIELPNILFSAYSEDVNGYTILRTAGNATSFFDETQMDTMVCEVSNGYYTCISLPDAFKMISNLGFYWGKETSAAYSDRGINCTDPNLVCALIDSDTHEVTDTVLTGSEISDYAISHQDDPYCNYLLDYGNTDEDDNPIGYTTDEYRDNFDPEQSTIEEADVIDINQPVIATTGGTTAWLMSENKLKEFFTYLWNPDGTIFDDIVKGCALLGENPMDSVISCRFFPLNLDHWFSDKFSSENHIIMFGRIPSSVNARNLTSSNVVTYELGSFQFNDAGMFRDFRDYEPYSQYSLYLPFVGIVPLSAIECINKTITIKYIVDLITAACTAVIFTNGVPYKYEDGMLGIEVPVTGRNMAQYGQQILGAALGAAVPGAMAGYKGGQDMVEGGPSKSGKAFKGAANTIANRGWSRGALPATGNAAKGLAIGAATAVAPAVLGAAFGIPGAALGGAVSALLNSPSPQQAGSNTPAMGLSKPLYPYFIVTRSDSWIPENYAKLYGRPLQQGGKVKDFTGFSKFGNLKMENINVATSEEKTLISEILESGVYI